MFFIVNEVNIHRDPAVLQGNFYHERSECLSTWTTLSFSEIFSILII